MARNQRAASASRESQVRESMMSLPKRSVSRGKQLDADGSSVCVWDTVDG